MQKAGGGGDAAAGTGRSVVLAHIAAVADGLLCGLVGKIVARLEENCKWLWGDDFDWAGVGCGLA